MAGNLQIAKRVQVNKAKAIILGLVVGASMLCVFSLVASKTYFSESQYLNKVADKKEAALKQLKANKAAVSTLSTAYKSFAAQNPNLIGGSSTGTGERDGDNGRLVLDALPSKYDFPALATSVEKLLTGYTINGISGSDDVASQTDITDSSQPVAMPFKLEVQTDYKSVQTVLTKFEKSIRPFQVQSIEITGTNATLQTVVNAQTYYQPQKDLTIKTEAIK